MVANDNFTYSLNLTNLPSSRYSTEAVVTMFMSPKTLPTQPKDHPLLGHRQLVSFQRLGTTGGLAPGASTMVTFVVGAYDLSIVDFGKSSHMQCDPSSVALLLASNNCRVNVC